MLAATDNNFFNEVWQNMPRQWPSVNDLSEWCEHMHAAASSILLIAGLIFLIFGYSIYRFLITLNAAVLAAVIGGHIGDKYGSGPFGAVVAGVGMAAATWPMMKWAVALIGGIFGAILGAAIWRGTGQDPAFAWAGAMIGLVFFGLLSFIVYRGCVITFMSLQGSVMLAAGILGLVYKFDGITSDLSQSLQSKPYLIPMFIFIASVSGLMYQRSSYPEVVAKK